MALTTGGVSYLDPLGYTKPYFRPVTVPTEAGFPRKYYVDLTSGSGGAAYTIGDPGSWAGLSGKAGIGDGTGAYVYVRGSGSMGSFTMIGGSGTEIVIKPWDDSTTCTITGRNNWTHAHRHLIFDGGPQMRIRFSSTGGNQFDPSIYVSESAADDAFQNVKFARTRWHVPGAGIHFAAWGAVTNLWFINSEFHATGSTVDNAQHHIYLSGNGSGSGGDGRTLDGIYLLGDIFYDTPGEAVELRMSDSASFLDNFLMDGCAAHNVGKGTAPESWKARGVFSFSTEGGGSFGDNGRVQNCVFWDTGEGAGRTWDNPSTWVLVNNTCIDWGMGDPANGQYCSTCFTNFNFNGASGRFRNNTMYATGSDDNGNAKRPFPATSSDTNKSHGACANGQTLAGTSDQANLTSGSFQSLDEDSADFGKPAAASTMIGNGTTTDVTATVDYLGNPMNSPPTIGAFQLPPETVPATGRSMSLR